MSDASLIEQGLHFIPTLLKMVVMGVLAVFILFIIVSILSFPFRMIKALSIISKIRQPEISRQMWIKYRQKLVNKKPNCCGGKT